MDGMNRKGEKLCGDKQINNMTNTSQIYNAMIFK